MNEKLPYKDQQSGKISSKSMESLEILEVRSREDLIEEWLALNPKDVIDFNETVSRKSLPRLP